MTTKKEIITFVISLILKAALLADELCQKDGIPLIIRENDDIYWCKRIDNRETIGDIILEWSMRK
jgi:hypothetical protein